MWFFPVTFFAFQFILRLWPGLMMQDIMVQFSVDAAGIGLLAAFYYYGYAGMQIPVALLLDKYGPRNIIFAFATLCGLGGLLFIYTSNFYLALLSRFLIGAGSAVGFLGVSKVISQWFSGTQYSQMVGFSFSVGLCGAIYGGRPVSKWIQTYNGCSVGFVLALLSISIGLFAYLVLRTPKSCKEPQSSEFKVSDLSALFSSKILWVLAVANLLMVGALEGFADVWGVPYLTTAYGFSKSDAALLTSFIYMGMIYGAPVIAYLSKLLGNYSAIGLCGCGLALVFTVLLSSAITNWWLLSILFFLTGMMCCYQVSIFAAGSTLVPPKHLGITVAFLNCVNMFGGSFFHTIIGKIMDHYWDGSLSAQGLKQYNLESFQHALTTIPLCALIGTGLIYLIHKALKRQHQLSSSVENTTLSRA